MQSSGQQPRWPVLTPQLHVQTWLPMGRPFGQVLPTKQVLASLDFTGVMAYR